MPVRKSDKDKASKPKKQAPASPSASQPAKMTKTSSEGEGLEQGKGKILMMDDETGIWVAVGKLVHRLGYEVEFAEDGDRAVELYRRAMEAGEPFDVVVLDLTIPGGMGGAKAVEVLLELDPDVKAIVSSGYSTDPVMAEHEKHGFKGVLTKPYSLQELSRALSEVLS